MPDLQRHQITKSGHKKVGRPLGSVPPNKFPLHKPDIVGKVSRGLTVISAEILRKNTRPYLMTECAGCGEQSPKAYCTVMQGTAGCRRCGNPRSAPKWLELRANAAKHRCTNPRDQRYKDYGARGIEFRFSSPLSMALWVQEHLGLHKHLEIDRINNNGHYEPGNLRYSTHRQNSSHTRKRPNASAFHMFRLQHPEVRYADSTLSRMIGSGLSFTDIVELWKRPTRKPKGVYGTFSMPDLFIASLHQIFSSQTA